MRTRKQNRSDHWLEILPNSINSIIETEQPLNVKMHKINGIDLDFIFKNEATPLKHTTCERIGIEYPTLRKYELSEKAGRTNGCKSIDRPNKAANRSKG